MVIATTTTHEASGLPAADAAATQPVATVHADAAAGLLALRDADRELLQNLGARVHSTLTLPARPARYADHSALPLRPETLRQLATEGRRLYSHQVAALARFAAGEDVLLATGTGSGKTVLLESAFIETRASQPGSLTVCFSPTKALARQLRERLTATLARAGMRGSVEMLTGDDKNKEDRARRLSSAAAVVCTPDSVHRWLLGGLSEKNRRALLPRIALVLLDEPHVYAGAFGSQMAHFLLRLQHAAAVAGRRRIRFAAASATLPNAGAHLQALTGSPVTVIGDADDGSPRHTRRIHCVSVLALTDLALWMNCVTRRPGERAVLFGQSRQGVETLTSLARRANAGHAIPEADEPLDEAGFSASRVGIYRGGIEPQERDHTLDRFATGDLTGIIATNALGLGMDFPSLNHGILLGLPAAPSLFWQQLGRFGRHGEADIFLVDHHSPRWSLFAQNPASVLDWRAEDLALYLDNPALVAQNAILLDHEAQALGALDETVLARVASPAFRTCLASLRNGEPDTATQDALRLSGSQPHEVFNLRDFEPTFQLRNGSTKLGGMLSHSQVMRECYPGAVYRENGTAWRVSSVDVRRRTVHVSPEREYHTKRIAGAPTLSPNLSSTGLLAASRFTDTGLLIAESEVRVTDTVFGFEEHRGTWVDKFVYAEGEYPTQTAPFFRTYTTTGVVLLHPALDAQEDACAAMAELFLDALPLEIPLERQDISAGCGRLKTDRLGALKGQRFFSVFDTTLGGLRLSSRLLETPGLLRRVLARAASLAEPSRYPDHDATRVLNARDVLLALSEAQSGTSVPLTGEHEVVATLPVGARALHPRSQRLFEITGHEEDPVTGEWTYLVRAPGASASSAVGRLPFGSLIAADDIADAA